MVTVQSKELSSVDLSPLASEGTLSSLNVKVATESSLSTAVNRLNLLATETRLTEVSGKLTEVSNKLSGNLSVSGSAINLSGSLTVNDTVALNVNDASLISSIASRLRVYALIKVARLRATVTTATDVIAAPTVNTQKHVICWIRVQNTTDTYTEVELTGASASIIIICPSKGSGDSTSANREICTLNAGEAFKVAMTAATPVEVNVGYYTMDATGAPV